MTMTIALIALLFAMTSRSIAAEDNPVEARAVDDKILCLARRNLIIAESSGPCDAFTAPPKVAVGQSFVANGKRRTIGVVRATQVDKDFKSDGIITKKGEWYCVAGETGADLDLEHNSSALWLFIPKCQPLYGIIQPITVPQFLKLPENIQAIYIAGLMEGMAFISYGNSAAIYPAWVRCVRGKTLGDTTKDVVAFIQQEPNFDEGVSSALAKTLGRRCKH